MTKKSKKWLRTIGVSAAIVAAGLCLYWLPSVMVQWTIKTPAQSGLDQEALTTAITANRQAVLFAIGGVIAVFTLILSLSKHSLDRDANMTNRYTEAIGQLGSDSMSIKLGGIYALERIAQDSLRDRQTILDVLCAYLRDACPAQRPGADDKKNADALAAITVIRRITILSKPSSPVDLRGTDLGEEADFRGANLEGALLQGSNLMGGTLEGANLTDAYLEGADLSYCNLRKANFTRADLNSATISLSSIEGMDVAGADLRMVTTPAPLVVGGTAAGSRPPVSRNVMANKGAIGTHAAFFTGGSARKRAASNDAAL